MNRRLTVLAALLGVATAITCIAIVVSAGGGDGGGRRAPSSRDVTAQFDGIPQDRLRLGSPSAKVLLVEFADPQCPFCREFAVRTLPFLVRRYVRTGKIRMELRLVSFLGPDSLRGAQALEAAGLQDRMWQAAARFYDRQGQENSGYVTDGFLRGVLGGVRGLDVARAMRDRKQPAVAAELGAVHSMQSRYAVTGTPTLLIGTDDANLRKVSEQTPSPEQIAATIDEELARQT
jgi:protein-disulfide isomerase